MNTTFSWIVTILIFIIVNSLLFVFLIKVEIKKPIAKYYYTVELKSGWHYESQEYLSIEQAIDAIKYSEFYGSFDMATLKISKYN